MPSLTRKVSERDIRLKDAELAAFAKAAKGRHTAWLREIGLELAKQKSPKFSFKMFEGTKLVGYESNPELHVVLKAIEAHMQRSTKHDFGKVTLLGESDDLPRTIQLDYFNGKLSLIYPVWHTIDLSSVTLAVPEAKRSEELEAGIAYVVVKKVSKQQHELVAAGVAASTLYVGFPKWMNTVGRTSKLGSRQEALAALADFIAERERDGYTRSERQPLDELRRKAKGKFPSWSFRLSTLAIPG